MSAELTVCCRARAFSMITIIGYSLIVIGIATLAAIVARIFAAPDDPETWP